MNADLRQRRILWLLLYGGGSANSVLTDSSILFTAGCAAKQYLNWAPIDFLPYQGTSTDGIDVSQATEANQVFMRIVNTYTDSGFDSVGEDELALDGEGWVLEPEAENLLTYSQEFDNAAWIKSGASSVTPNTGIAPDGTTTVDTITGFTGSGTNDVSQNTGASSSSQTATFSLWLSGNGSIRLNLSNFVDSSMSQVVSLTSELTRYEITHTFTATAANIWAFIDDASGSTATSIDVWGAQVEIGSVATSYIPTTGLSATRAQDNGFVNTDEAFIDNPDTATVGFVVPDVTAGSFVNGIFYNGATAIRLAIGGVGSTVNSKYRTNSMLLVNDVINTQLVGNNGVIIEVTNTESGFGFSDGTWFCQLVKNPTGLSDEDAVMAAFENDGTSNNKILALFTDSSFSATDMLTIRTDAGDLGPFTKLPTSECKHRIEFIPFGDITTPTATLASMWTSGNDRTLWRTTGATANARFLSVVGGATAINLATANDINTGEVNVMNLTLGAIGGVNESSLHLNGGAKDLGTLNSAIYDLPLLRYGARSDGAEPMNVKIIRHTITDLSDNVIMDRIFQ